MSEFPYVYRWNRMGRKGQRCRVTARGTMNSACVVFEDGFTAVISRNALRRAPSAWRIVSPAPPTAVLALAGAGARVRRMVLAQSRSVESAAVYRGDDAMAVAYFGRHGWRRVEMALSIAPAAGKHMGRLVRMAQLTLFAMAEDRIVVTRIRSSNTAGQRMAMLCGFRRRGHIEPGVWFLRKERHEKPFRE